MVKPVSPVMPVQPYRSQQIPMPTQRKWNPNPKGRPKGSRNKPTPGPWNQRMIQQ